MRAQSKKNWPYAFIQALQALGPHHLQETVSEAAVVPTLKGETRETRVETLRENPSTTNTLATPASITATVWVITETHLTKLVHWLVVEACADDIKRRHGDRHGDATYHGGC